MSSSAWRSFSLATCALIALLEVFTTLCLTGMGGLPPWSGRLGAVTTRNVPYGFIIASLQAGGPAERAGMVVGDRVDLRFNSLLDRYPLSEGHPPLNGRPIAFIVSRGTARTRIVVIPAARIGTGRRGESLSPLLSQQLLQTGLTLWLVLLGGLIAWRRSDSPQMRLLAWALILYAGDAAASDNWVTPWVWPSAIQDWITNFIAPLAAVMWVLLAGTFGRPLSGLRRVIAWFAYASIGVWTAQSVANSIAKLTSWFAWNLPAIRSPNPSYVAFVAATVASILAIAAARENERKRAAWLLIPLVFLWLSPILIAQIKSNVELTYALGFLLNGLGNAVQLLAPAALTYAALSRRVVDFGFALKRSVAFAIVSVVVILTFLGVEWGVGTWFQGITRTSSAVIGLAVALGLGLSLRYVHGGVDRFVDRAFFRKRRDDVDALRRFAHEAGFITDRATLIDLTEQEVREHTDAISVSILLFNETTRSYTSAAPNGQREMVDENDPGIVALRAWRKPVEIHAVPTSSLRGEYAFPMVARGVLVGVLICGAKRDGEAYAPDEYEALRLLADGVGAALDALGRRAEDSLVDLREAIVAAIRTSHEALLDELRAARNK